MGDLFRVFVSLAKLTDHGALQGKTREAECGTALSLRYSAEEYCLGYELVSAVAYHYISEKGFALLMSRLHVEMSDRHQGYHVLQLATRTWDSRVSSDRVLLLLLPDIISWDPLRSHQLEPETSLLSFDPHGEVRDYMLGSKEAV